MKEVMKYLPFILPIFIIEMVLMLIALIHVIKYDNFKVGNKAIWIIIVVVFQIIGPVAYFIIGRGEE